MALKVYQEGWCIDSKRAVNEEVEKQAETSYLVEKKMRKMTVARQGRVTVEKERNPILEISRR